MKTCFTMIGLIAMATVVAAQVQVGNYGVRYVFSVPTGSCGSNTPLTIVQPGGTLYTCQNGTYATAGGGSVVAPGGNNQEVQINNSGSFGAATGVTYNGANGLAATGSISLGGGLALNGTALGGTATLAFATNLGFTATTNGQLLYFMDGSVGARRLALGTIGTGTGVLLAVSQGIGWSPDGALLDPPTAADTIIFRGSAGAVRIGASGATNPGTLDLSTGNAATGSNNFNSGPIKFGGNYWTGAASAQDSWTITNVMGNGTNPPNTLTFTHIGAAPGFTVSVPSIRFSSINFSSLPGCSGPNQGLQYNITDATAPTFLGTVVGGGTVYTPVICNGTNWVAQ